MTRPSKIAGVATVAAPVAAWYLFWKYLAPILFRVGFYLVVAVAAAIYAPFALITAVIEGDWQMAWGALLMCMFTGVLVYIVRDIKNTIVRQKLKADADRAYIDAHAPVTDSEHRALSIVKARLEAGERPNEVEVNSPQEWAVYQKVNYRITAAQCELADLDYKKDENRRLTEKAIKVIPAYLKNGYSETQVATEHPEEWHAYVVAGKPVPLEPWAIPTINHGNYGWGSMLLAVFGAILLFILIAIISLS